MDADGSYLLVVQHLSQNSSDANELLPAYHSIHPKLGSPTELIADAGYINMKAFEQLMDVDCQPYVSVSSEHAHNERHYDFRPDKPRPVKPVSHPMLLKMRGEWELICLAYNCKRLHKIIQSR